MTEQDFPAGISAIVPARNEADRIGDTIAAAAALPSVLEIIVVDDASLDATSGIAEAAGARVVRLTSNVGKAGAVMAGLAAARFRWILLLDADLGSTASEAFRLCGPVVDGTADMTIARFPEIPGRGGGSGIVVRLARWGAGRLAGIALRAPLSGQRCLTREAVATALPFSGRFGMETSLNIAVARAGLRIVEVETTMDHRVTQNDWRSRIHRARQCWDVGVALAKSARYPWAT
ncbi:MAG: glycosyltransferase family 2 protein [Armatimonadota bacterium]